MQDFHGDFLLGVAIFSNISETAGSGTAGIAGTAGTANPTWAVPMGCSGHKVLVERSQCLLAQKPTAP